MESLELDLDGIAQGSDALHLQLHAGEQTHVHQALADAGGRAQAGDAGAVAGTANAMVDGSGNLTVSFIRDGESFSYTFEKSGDGLVLAEE